ncbi:DUF6293 family protein [Candidatus Micrarchaeota archaeon]|nr:DUF6293 family protein [Candidatus Micrarchaeota archaeon]
MKNVRLRVHIAPLGFEIDRIVLPLQELKADKVWLLTHSKGDQASAYREKVISLLEKADIRHELAECDITDLYDVLRTFRLIIEKEAENDIFINVSSGSKIEAIAGMMASMIFKNGTQITPYYVVPKKYLVEPEGIPLTEGVESINALPEYRMEQPKKQLLDVLKLIDQAGGAISKKDLIEEAERRGLIVVGGRNPTQSKYISLNKNYLEPLQSWKLVKIQKDRRWKNILLTDEGRNMLRFLG